MILTLQVICCLLYFCHFVWCFHNNMFCCCIQEEISWLVKVMDPGGACVPHSVYCSLILFWQGNTSFFVINYYNFSHSFRISNNHTWTAIGISKIKNAWKLCFNDKYFPGWSLAEKVSRSSTRNNKWSIRHFTPPSGDCMTINTLVPHTRYPHGAVVSQPYSNSCKVANWHVTNHLWLVVMPVSMLTILLLVSDIA